MNRKSNHQNLLRRVLALAVVMITMFALPTGAWAQQGTGEGGNGEIAVGSIVTLYANNGTDTKTEVHPESSIFTIPECTFSNGDLPFLGWATLADGDVKYQPEDKITLTNNLRLYAKWAETSGTFGNLTWSLTKSVGSADYDVLTISGIGQMSGSSSPWSYYKNNIKTIVIGDGVTSIGEAAFDGFSNVTSLTIGNSVQTIGESAFYGLTSLTSLSIGNGVQTIGEKAFGDLDNLTSDIIFPASLTSLGKYAFSGVASKTANGISITAAEGSQLASISSNAFSGAAKAVIDLSNCAKLETIGGDQTFLGTKDVTLPHTVTNISEYAFGRVNAFWGEHVYIVVPEGQKLTVNGEPYDGVLTDGKADLIPYLFDDPANRVTSKALTLSMEEAVAPVAGSYQLSGENVLFFPENSTDLITAAVEGQKVTVSFDYFASIGDNYFTGNYTSDDVTITVDEEGDGTFTMPAMAVTVTPVLAPQEEYVINLTTATTQTIPESMWLLLPSLGKYYIYDDETNEHFFDLNLDGKYDIQMIKGYSVTRLEGADDITSDEDLCFPLSYVHNLQYNSVQFFFNEDPNEEKPDPEPGQPALFETDEDGNHIFDEDGNPIPILKMSNNLKEALGVDAGLTVGLSANAAGQASVNEQGDLTVKQSANDVQLSVQSVTAGTHLVCNTISGTIQGHRLIVKGILIGSRTRGDMDDLIELQSGVTYEVLKDCDLILTLKTSVSDVVIQSLTITPPDPNDLNHDGKVNAIDIVKAVSAGKTKAEIDAIVNAIMGK